SAPPSASVGFTCRIVGGRGRSSMSTPLSSTQRKCEARKSSAGSTYRGVVHVDQVDARPGRTTLLAAEVVELLPDDGLELREALPGLERHPPAPSAQGPGGGAHHVVELALLGGVPEGKDARGGRLVARIG